jgi:hypothetical protein
MQAERVVSAKIEFIRENRVEATQTSNDRLASVMAGATIIIYVTFKLFQ